MVELSISSSNVKRSKKPKPLFGLFRKNKPADPIRSPRINPLGSGTNVPLSSIIPEPTLSDPYTPPSQRSPFPGRKPPCASNLDPNNARPNGRPRSKSVGRDTSGHQHRPCARSLTVREQTFNKLCQRELPSYTGDSVSSSYAAPPLPAIPVQHQGVPPSPRTPILGMATPSSPLSPRPTHKLRKISSAHDLYKANKHQRDCINTTVEKIPMPKMDLARSRSLNAPKKARLPLVPSEMPFSSSVSARQRPMQSSHIRVASASDTSRRFASNPNDEDDDDDDVPLAATAGIMPLSAISSMHQKQPICRPSSLLNDHDEEDDKDLVPIAVLAQTEIKADQEEYLSAADKYKEKVKERLNLDDGNEDEDDDDIPISVAHMRSLRNQPQHKTRPDVMDMWMSPATQTV